MSTLPERLDTILRRHLPLDRGDVLDPHVELSALGLDSMGAVKLLFEIEAEFDITFPDDAIDPSTFATPTTLRSALERAIAG